MNETQKTSSFSQALLWFGAAVSIAEILTGALLAPLGLAKGFLAILLGHVIGCIVFYFAGLIGAKSGLSAIETTRLSFGKYGSYFFSILNVIQLLGWTAVMTISGAQAMDTVTASAANYKNQALWCVVIGAFIVIWILIGVKNLSKLNVVVMALLFVSSVVLGVIVLRGVSSGVKAVSGTLTFGAAVELSVTMPLSWLPLISDYTRTVKHPKAGSALSAVGYFIGSCMMYGIGLAAAVFAGTSDISAILVSAGLGTVALFIVIFSTVTTTFLDAYSGGVSIVNLNKKINEKYAALAVCVVGTVIAIFVSMDLYVNFLYFIGSVFAPLFAVVITDYFLLKGTEINEKSLLNVKNLVIWAVGFAGYQILLHYDSPVGTTLPVMAGVSVLCLLAAKFNIILYSKKQER
jgi:putative hydroxymethylpyrimidine transporter CytX